MSAQELKISRGEMIVFTEGAYSDYRIAAVLVAIENLDLALLAQKYWAERKSEDPDLGGFGTWLVAQRLALPVANREIYLGDYGQWVPEFGIKE